MVEYDQKEPCALIEYKKLGARVNLHDANNTTLRRLADRAQLPLFLVMYRELRPLFGVVPVNDLAKKILPDTIAYQEPEYVKFLHRVRGRK